MQLSFFWVCGIHSSRQKIINLSRVDLLMPLFLNHTSAFSLISIDRNTSCGGFTAVLSSRFLSWLLTLPRNSQPVLWHLNEPVVTSTESDRSRLFFRPSWHFGQKVFSAPCRLVSLIPKSE